MRGTSEVAVAGGERRCRRAVARRAARAAAPAPALPGTPPHPPDTHHPPPTTADSTQHGSKRTRYIPTLIRRPLPTIYLHLLIVHSTHGSKNDDVHPHTHPTPITHHPLPTTADSTHHTTHGSKNDQLHPYTHPTHITHYSSPTVYLHLPIIHSTQGLKNDQLHPDNQTNIHLARSNKSGSKDQTLSGMKPT